MTDPIYERHDEITASLASRRKGTELAIFQAQAPRFEDWFHTNAPSRLIIVIDKTTHILFKTCPQIHPVTFHTYLQPTSGLTPE